MLFCTYDGHIPEVINYCVISLILFRCFGDVFRWQNVVSKWVTKFLSLKFRVWTAYYEFIYSRIADNLRRPWTVYSRQWSVFRLDGPWSLRKHWFISNFIPKNTKFFGMHLDNFRWMSSKMTSKHKQDFDKKYRLINFHIKFVCFHFNLPKKHFEKKSLFFWI